MNAKHHRRSIFIDRPLQTALLVRAVLYLSVILMAQLLIVFFFALVTSSQEDFLADGPKLWWHLQLSALAWIVLIPMILLDLLKLSHRWVGPVHRLRGCLRALSRGENVNPIRFRTRDFWHEMANDINLVAAELDRQRAGQPEELSIHESTVATNPRETALGPQSSPTSAAI